MGSSLLIFVFLFGTVLGAGKPCSDIVTVRDNGKNTATPSILYFEGAGQQIAQISCDDNNGGVVELISSDKSLGVIEGGSHRALCWLGRWYSLNKYGTITPIKEVACVVHPLFSF